MTLDQRGGPPEGIGLPAFNALPDEQARELLLGCCHAGRWAAAVAGGRPYRALGALLARAARNWPTGTWPRHWPGTRGSGGPGRRAEFPVAARAGRGGRGGRGGARGTGGGQPGLRGAVRPHLPGVRERAQREELLGILNQTGCGTGPTTERAGRAGELGTINDLRLTTLDGARPRARPALSRVSTHVLGQFAGGPAAGVPVRLERAAGGGSRWPRRSPATTGGSRRWGRTISRPAHTGSSSAPGRISPGPGSRHSTRRSRSASSSATRGGHYHVPLVLSPFAYATYRGN